jgi:hypothetical protein
VSPGDLSGLENLRSLSLSDNLISDLGEVTFRRLSRLRWLHLDGKGIFFRSIHLSYPFFFFFNFFATTTLCAVCRRTSETQAYVKPETVK